MTYQNKQKIKALVITKDAVNLKLAKQLCISLGLTEKDALYFIKTTIWEPRKVTHEANVPKLDIQLNRLCELHNIKYPKHLEPK